MLISNSQSTLRKMLYCKAAPVYLRPKQNSASTCVSFHWLARATTSNPLFHRRILNKSCPHNHEEPTITAIRLDGGFCALSNWWICCQSSRAGFSLSASALSGSMVNLMSGLLWQTSPTHAVCCHVPRQLHGRWGTGRHLPSKLVSPVSA